MVVGGLMLLGACDTPSSGPSFETETGLNTPVVVNKTFTLLGGPESQNEPLIDTTTSQFDSLFTVAASDQSLSIEEDVSSFDIGSLDQALDEATEGVGADTSIAETVIQGNDLATQEVNANYREENGRPDPTPSSEEGPLPVADTTLSFPPGLLAIPDYEIANIDADTVRRGTLTDEPTYSGPDYTGPVNEIAFTLSNNNPSSSPLEGSDGEAPAITIRDRNGKDIGTAQFASAINPGNEAEATADVEGGTIGEDSQLVLDVSGSDDTDALNLELSPLRYKQATVAGINDVEVTASDTASTRGGNGGAEFEGIETRDGTLELALTNNLQFPVDITSLSLENNQGTALPDTFEVLGVSESAQSIPPDESRTFEVNLEGRGIASVVDVAVQGGLANSHMADTLTAAAEDNIDVSVGGDLTIGAMFFWPDGETVQAGGTFDFEQDRISFDRPGDFMELDAGTLALDNLVSEPTVAFDSFVLSFPDIRGDDYGLGDSLTVEFS
ncbi:MAG: hypothetical protein BRD51_06520, partial [Bacteroidetes bacterium SW_11_64_17]